jgi:hypothetical protein
VNLESVRANNHRHAFEMETSRGLLSFPYAKADPAPTRQDPVAEVWVDEELGSEAATYRLTSGAEGSVHVEQALEYNRDPAYMRDLLLYRLTLEAEKRIAESQVSRREIIRRLGTSPSQLYRLLDPTNRRKTIDAMVQLLAAAVHFILMTSNPGGQCRPKVAPNV